MKYMDYTNVTTTIMT